MATVNGKTLNHFSSYYTHRNKDNSGNDLLEGDTVFHVSGSRSRTYSIKTVILLQEDQTGEEFLGIRLDNGQFSTLGGVDIFKVDANFAKEHAKFMSTSHLG